MYLQHHGNDRVSIVWEELDGPDLSGYPISGPFNDYLTLMHAYMEDLCMRDDGVRVCELEIRTEDIDQLMELIDATTRLNGGVKLDVFISEHPYFDEGAWLIELGIAPMARLSCEGSINTITDMLSSEGYNVNPRRD